MGKAYITYKDSGVSSYGRIPTDWQVSRFKYFFTNFKGLSITKSNLLDKGIPCVSYGDIHSKFGFELIPEIHNLKSVSENYLINNSNALLKKGDFVFADTSEDLKGSGNFTYLNSDVDTFAGYHTIVIRPNQVCQNRFFAYLFDSIYYRSQIQRLVKGVKVYSITNRILKDTFILCPSDYEQVQIVSYLDYHTNKIDRLIAKKEALIEKLKEQRQAIINEAVTKGLNKEVKLKDSGIEWLGEIPEHWEVVRLKHLTDSVDTGKTPPTNNKLYFDKGSINWFSPGDFISLFLIKSNKKITKLAVKELNIKLYPKNTVLLIGIGATLGKVAIVVEECFSNQQINSIQFKEDVLSPFFGLFFLDSIKEVIKNESNSSTMAILNQSKTKELLLTVPPLDEQNKIEDFIKSKVDQFAHSIVKIQTSIQKLKEYRQSLISEAVTGKIDVRDWVAPKQ
ncbi:restriction endonuclease subunit S [Aquimarina rhabdastrellae]